MCGMIRHQQHAPSQALIGCLCWILTGWMKASPLNNYSRCGLITIKVPTVSNGVLHKLLCYLWSYMGSYQCFIHQFDQRSPRTFRVDYLAEPPVSLPAVRLRRRAHPWPLGSSSVRSQGRQGSGPWMSEWYIDWYWICTSMHIQQTLMHVAGKKHANVWIDLDLCHEANFRTALHFQNTAHPWLDVHLQSDANPWMHLHLQNDANPRWIRICKTKK